MSLTALHISSPIRSDRRTELAFGSAISPIDGRLSVDNIGLRFDGRYAVPVMGEIHYSRLPPAAWRDALLKMKAGGITVVACYVFWIHHEEVAGHLNWAGDRDLAAFVRRCGEVGLPCVVRCGPWCHGEVRNGGLPEWVIDRHKKTLRTDDPAYLADVARWYAAIADQLRGLLWKDGGPVIGVQIENEYGGKARHLLTLKKLAIDAGLDVPLYTRTGWPELNGDLPFGELLPLFGGYAEGFWDRELITMPWRYRSEFQFKTVRTDAAIANEHFGDKVAVDPPGTDRYPYLTCEIGAGMMCSYHRRITVFPQDALALAIVKLGSGSNLPGYYMYHGGTNPESVGPEGIEPNLNEHQATRYTNYNDLPTKNYDFQTALGEFGQVRPQYHLLRLLHLFLADFGEQLAPMATVLPEWRDETALRYGVRTDGRGGFVFINNYQRLQPMPAKPDVSFQLDLPAGPLNFPRSPVTVAADASFVWPFGVDLGGVRLDYATAQLVCQVDNGDVRYVVFARTGNPAEFAFSGDGVTIDAGGRGESAGGRTVLSDVPTGRTPFVTMTNPAGRRLCVILLDEADALRLWKGDAFGRPSLVLTEANVIFDEDSLRLSIAADVADVAVSVIPAPPQLRVGGATAAVAPDGAFGWFRVPVPARLPMAVSVQQTKSAGPLRAINLGVAGVAEAPTEADFADAAEWHVSLPRGARSADALLRIHYAGDVARAYCGGRLVADHFYNGTPFEIGLGRLGEAADEGLTIRILPLQSDAPIYMLDAVRPDAGGATSLAAIRSVDVLETTNVELTH